MEITAIIQARMGSTRLPGKVLREICGKPVLWHIVNRVSGSDYLDKIIIATSDHPADDIIEQFTMGYKLDVYRGSQYNVLERFYKCAVQYKTDLVVRLTGDNALIDPHIIDLGIEYFIKETGTDYLYYREGLPLGMAVEIFTFQALETAYKEATDAECLEHVTPYLYKNSKFNAKRVSGIGKNYSNYRWTMDTEQDYNLIKKIYENLYRNEEDIFYFEDILEQYLYHDEWSGINSGVKQIRVNYKGETEVE